MLAATCNKPSSSSSVKGSQLCRQFEFSDILQATGNFDEQLVIGKGGFGKVYIGKVTNGSSRVLAAIKRLDPMSSQGAAEFWAEVEMLYKVRHGNLVSLIGYCNYEKENEMILVYEYMPNRTLEDHLHKLRTPLSWVQRLQICIGVGRGLHYLHTGTGIETGVIHRDVKSSNILLNEKWAAKLSDFGLSRQGPINQTSSFINTVVKGTFGYLDPDYVYTGKLTRKSDVYSFGVVLLEVLCRKRAVDTSLDEDQMSLAIWAIDSIKKGNLKNIVDSNIRGEISPKCLKEFVRTVERCLHSSRNQRSTMAEVVASLETVLTTQEKNNGLLQAMGRTIFSGMLNMFFSFLNRDKSGHGDPKLSSNNNMIPADCIISRSSLKAFEYNDLIRATSLFNDKLLIKGHVNDVFFGWVDKNTYKPSNPCVGIPVAVLKLFPSSSFACDEWMEKMRLLGRLAHPNIINLLGYCDNEHECLLVYEHMRSLNFGELVYRDSHQPLSWGTRLSIIMGVARGLTYLHLSNFICHGFRSSDIFLDQILNAKLWAFESDTLKVIYTVLFDKSRGYGYKDPYYYSTGIWCAKNDIFSFGVLLLETVTGLRVYDEHRPHKQVKLIKWASRLNKGDLKEIMDPRLEKNYPEEAAFECITLALRCVAEAPKDRPSTVEVLKSLERIYDLKK